MFRLGLFCVLLATRVLAQSLTVTVHDARGTNLAGAVASLESSGGPVQRVASGETGTMVFADLKPGSYHLTVSAQGFDGLSADVVIGSDGDASAARSFDAVLSVARHSEIVTVSETADAPLKQSASPPVALKREEVRDLPGKPASVADALPLAPGIVRMPDGSLRLSGSGEHRSALLINGSDATDPSTGQFGATAPVDGVQTVNVMSSPFLAEYGGFSSTVVSVETRRAGDKWHFEINDPLPEFRWRSWHMTGLRSSTPRISFGGPVLENRLYVLESIQYEVRTIPVITLPFPDNQQRREGYNSLTEVDYTVSRTNLLNVTLHAADTHTRYANLDYFNPEPVSPDDSASSLALNVIDHASIGNTLLDSSITATSFRTAVWPQGPLPMTIAPTGDSGNYFSGQTRDSSREEWRETWSFARSLAGTHNLKFGSVLTMSTEHAQVEEHDVEIVGATGLPLESIAFTQGQPIRRTDFVLGLFAQDEWTMGNRFALSAGIRAERRQAADTDRAAPRAGFVWTPRSGTVVRGGAGLFFDSVPLNVFGFPSYPEQIITRYSTDGTVSYGPQVFYNLEGRGFAPRSRNGNIRLEQTVTSGLRLSASWLQSRSSGLIVLTPEVTPSMNAYLLNGGGKSSLDQLETTAAVRAGRESRIYLSYVRSHATGNLNEFSTYLGNFPPAIILPDAHTTLPGNVPNRFLAWGTVSLPGRFHIMPRIEYRSGFPWSAVDAMQNYVGVPDTRRFPGYLSADAKVTRDFKVSDKYTVRIGVTGSNLTNHFNPVSVHSNTADPAYGVYFGEYRRRYTVDFDVIF